MIDAIVKEHNAVLLEMSNISGKGVFEVKSKACDIL